MRLLTVSADSVPSFPKLSLSLVSSTAELREVQRLRYKVFIEAMGLSALANRDGLDQDDYDPYCDHLIVRDNQTLKIVGTYRVLPPSAVEKTGGFYSEKEFNLSRLNHLRSRITEAGRACIHPDYRSGSVIMMLWAGLAACMRKEKSEYLIGCASVSLADNGNTINSICRSLTRDQISPAEYRVEPLLAFPLHEEPLPDKWQMPPLIKGYLKSGAWICGDPAWDPDFHTADLFMMLPLSRLDSRYARHYLKDTEKEKEKEIA